MADFRISDSSGNTFTESDIRLNYGDPSRILTSANDNTNFLQAIFFSTDGGANWGSASLPLVSGESIQGDPAVDWTSDGLGWALCLGGTGLADLRVRAYTSADGGATWNLDGTASGTQTATDREIVWVDHSATSPFKDQVYATWHTGVPVFFSRRTAGAGGSWQTPIQLSSTETTGVGIGGDIKSNSFGDVFVFWPDADGSRNIVVVKSTDGGVSFSAPLIIATTFATTRKLALPGDNNRKARVYISAGAYRTATKDLVYAVWADLSGQAGCTTGGGPGSSVSSTCKIRVWFTRSTNGGANWSAPVMINNQSSLNDQFHPKLCVDESNGNILVVYRDTVNDSGRLKPDVWMQTSTDDGQTWSAAVQVNSSPSDETDAAANGNQYGDYDGLTGFFGRFFPSWTDRRNSANPEEIWGAQLSIVQKQCFFIVDRSTFGQDEVDAMLLQGSPTVNEAFYVVVEGFTAAELGITAADLSGAPTTKPTFNSNPAVMGMTIGEPTTLIADDPTLPASPQRFTWFYPITFTSSAGFTSDVITVTLNASISTVNGSAQIQLLQQPNPFESDGQTTWLSTDLRVFRIKAGESKFGATVNGNSPNDAVNFIQQVITNLNPGGNSGGQTFESNLSLSQSASTLTFSQFDTDGTTAIFNFAIAKVRYRAIAQDAQSVRVFFRLCPALTVSCTYDGNDPTPNVSHTVGNVYRRFTDGVQHGQAISLLGTQNNNILTIPCFAALRTAGDMTGQQDEPNVQTIVHNTTGEEIHRYYGCWLDINQPADSWYPLHPTNDGPFASGKKSILELVRNQHQCLLSEIVFDSEPIPNGVGPGSSDKIAQRNLAITTSANPGEENSRRIPNTFEIRPTPAESGKDSPDELMIKWGNTPAGSVARIYLPAVSADEVIEMASRRYFSAKLSRVDDHTIECPVGGITYIPIPPGPVLNHAGLLTVDLPASVRKEQLYRIVVRQFTRASSSQKVIGGIQSLIAPAQQFNWKKVRGAFQISIPVTTREVMLAPEERLLAILRWILLSIPRHDRWYPVFQRYVDEIADRVRGLGGNPDEIIPDPHGTVRRPGAVCENIKWLVPLILAPLIVLIGLSPLIWAAPLAAVGLVLILAITSYWYWRCRPSVCHLLCALIFGIGVAYLVLGTLVVLGYRSPELLLLLAILGILNGFLLIIAAIRGCCGKCAELR